MAASAYSRPVSAFRRHSSSIPVTSSTEPIIGNSLYRPVREVICPAMTTISGFAL